jgi:small conductance mechanosensitive channel
MGSSLEMSLRMPLLMKPGGWTSRSAFGYGSDIEKAYGVIHDLLKQDNRILPDPAPEIAAAELADWRVNFVIRPWLKKEDYWPVRFDLTRGIKEAFDKNGIEIPFPQQAVHMISAGRER